MTNANTRTNTKTILAAALWLLVASMLFLAPLITRAAETSSRLGGGNALARATAGQSQSLSQTNPASNLLIRLTFASFHGGGPDEVPPAPQGGDGESGAASGTGGSTATGGSGVDGTTGEPPVQSNTSGNGGNPSTSSGQVNGGAQAGAGGDGGAGGSASPGGLVRSGDVVSNATAINAINVTIIRISSRLIGE